jgi:hypothetical protein
MQIPCGQDGKGGHLWRLMRALTLALVSSCLAVPLFAQAGDPATIPVNQEKPTLTLSYWTAVGIAATSASFDAYTTARYVGHEGYCDHEEMSPWLYGTKAPDARVYAIITAEAVATATLSYFLKKKSKKWWSIPLVYTTVIHARGAINNLSHCR